MDDDLYEKNQIFSEEENNLLSNNSSLQSYYHLLTTTNMNHVDQELKMNYFKTYMHVKTDIDVLKSFLFYIGILMIIIGIVANVLFSAYVFIKKRRTSSELILFTICVVHFLYFLKKLELKYYQIKGIFFLLISFKRLLTHCS